MGYIEKASREQATLLPDRIEDYIGENNPVRVIDVFVDGLDLEEMGFEKATPAETGRPPYDPRDLLKLYIYGYLNKIRSSRKLMLECGCGLRYMLYIRLRGLQLLSRKHQLQRIPCTGFMLFKIVQTDKVQRGSEPRLRLLPRYEFQKSMH